MPSYIPPHPFEHIIGAVDCTTHFHTRVHPCQGDYYQCDKHGHFLTAQVICSIYGDEVYHVAVGLGHNNDAAMMILTGFKDGLIHKGQKLIADRGYGSAYAVLSDVTKSCEWNHRHAALRSIVERVNARTATFAVASSKFRGTPEFQAIALMCVYHIVQHELLDSPLLVQYRALPPC
jgi:hypothetical protein